jgi:hypothetical protein
MYDWAGLLGFSKLPDGPLSSDLTHSIELASKKPPGTWAVAKRLKKPRTWAVRRGQATSGNLRSSTWKPSLAIWAAKRLALISVER